jgi:ubiquinone biosynthesis protein
MHRLREALLDGRRSVSFVAAALSHGTPAVVRWAIRRPDGAQALGVRLRLFVESLGITYVKLGQFLASRFDVLPMEVCQELSRLFEAVPPMPFAEARAQIERELGGPLDRFFVRVDETCIGSASVAQVLRAETLDGEVVAVKVQRPGVREALEADLRNLRRIARLADWLGFGRRLSLAQFADEFAAYTLREIDQAMEGRTAERVRRGGSPGVHVPRIRWDLTTPRLLTMEYIDGVSFSQINQLLEQDRADRLAELLPGVDLNVALRDLAWATLHQLFVAGFFHADPHPGNILIRRDGVVCLIDFGIFGWLDADRRETLSRYLEHITLGNIDQGYREYEKLVTFSPHTDVAAFRREVKAVLRGFHAATTASAASSLCDRHLGRYTDAVLRLLYAHHVSLDLNTLLYWRTLMVLDATTLRCRATDLQEVVREFFRATRPGFFERLASVADPERLAAAFELARAWPERAGRLAAAAASGRLLLPVRVEADRRVNRESTRGVTYATGAIAAALAAAVLVALGTV